MKYYVDEETGVVHIVDRWFVIKESEVVKKTVEKGAATKFKLNISGKVIDKESKEALPYVSAFVKGTANGSTSNVDGYIVLLDVPSDTSTIVFNYIGYQPKELSLMPGAQTKDLTIEMEPQVQRLEEVIVAAEREDILQVSGEHAGMIKMSPLKLKSIPNLGERDILRSFQLMPGISAANENSSGLYVRGGTPDQVLVLYDGFTVYNVEHMFGFFSAFNSNAIKDVQLYKGGFDAKYGGRTSSVLEITGKEGNQNEFNMAADLSLMSINGFVEFPIGKKASVILAGRRSWQSPLYNKIFNQYSDNSSTTQGGNMPQAPSGGIGSRSRSQQETISYFYDLNGKFTYRPTDKDIIGLSIYNGEDHLDNSLSPNGGRMGLSSSITDLTNWGNTGASLKWSRQHNDRFYGNLLVSYSNYFSDRDRSTSGSFVSGDSTIDISRGHLENNNLLDYTAKMDFGYKLTKDHHLGFGVQATHNDIQYAYQQNDSISIIDRNTEGQTYSLYLEDKITLMDRRWMLTPGLRYNYFTGTEKSYYEPRLNSTYILNDRIKLKGSTGLYYQFARRVVREDINEGSRDFWVLSDNDKLPVSSSLQFIGGASYETPMYLFDVEGFYKKLNNVTEYSLRIETNRDGTDYSENFFTGDGESKGIDFLVQKKHGDFTGWLGYTLAQVTNYIPEFGDYHFHAAHDVTHEFKAVFTYTWRRWDLGMNWIYASGKPYTAPQGGYQVELPNGSSESFITVSSKNGNRLPDYHRLDMSATYNFKIGQQAPASIGFSVFNVYNRSNVWYMEYEITDEEIIQTPVYYLGITPNVTLSVKLK
ncbi:TonB-dependent receptor [Flammeovirga aprica JL-4]|uniref:TonB-dependent receptor n=2 Tax=Flammeovirga aprica TaxID=29528 RepID=A0A7X9S0U5_9BACT|nr:TonB-dependent receptor [Flammeovirga aprica JL-4]